MKGNQFTKEDLEKEKLKLEVSELKKSWIRKPVHFFPMLTFIIALGTIIWSFSSGLINIQFQRLGLEKEKLEKDIYLFSIQKDSLLKQNKDIRDSLIAVKSSLKQSEISYIKSYRAHEKRLSDSLSKFKNQSEICNYYKSKLDSISKLIIKEKIIDKALSTESGQYITTESGELIIPD